MAVEIPGACAGEALAKAAGARISASASCSTDGLSGLVRCDSKSAVESARSRRDNDDARTSGRVLASRSARMRRGQLQAVHLRHQPIEDGDVEGSLRSIQPSASCADAVARGLHAPPGQKRRPGSVRLDSLSSTTSTRRPMRPSIVISGRASPVPGATGETSVKWNVLPLPGSPSLSAQTLPPISSASRRLIASPRPVPPNRRVTDASAWLNDWNRRSSSPAECPRPCRGSRNAAPTRRCRPAAGYHVTVNCTSPCLGELQASC